MWTALKGLSKLEWCLWLGSAAIVTGSFFCAGSGDLLTLIASLIGVTALIFVAKGHVLGQILTVVFAVFYGVISLWFHYYGEMITYLGMTAPIAVLTVVEWIRHPFQGTAEVRVAPLTRKRLALMLLLTAVVTGVFHIVLRAMGNANLALSTVSVATSFIASYLTLCRSHYYALGYAANDLVLIGLWVLATLEDASYLPMVFCFVMFFVNDTYGFYNWGRMKKRQEAAAEQRTA